VAQVVWLVSSADSTSEDGLVYLRGEQGCALTIWVTLLLDAYCAT